MMGGYQIIDFKSKLNVANSDGIELKGVFNTIKNSKKEIRLKNLNCDGVIFPSITTNFYFGDVLEALVIAGGNMFRIQITTDDIVRILTGE